MQAAAEQQPKPRPARTYRYAHGRMRRTSRISPDCFGLTKQEVATTLRRNHRNIATCYHKHVGLSCSHRMQIDIHVRLRRDGEVTKATITQRTFYSASFESCLLQKVQQWKFPNLRSRTFAFTYPLLFR
ncbi:MAG: hypothetical protein EP343_19060 [Deltaproteobacteria bacterium]|nr:MAG: hypothetical protein EP343_19060 [Deltaproteobacteria bacterium]